MTAPLQGSRWRRWRRSRPFWGGLLMILSAIELFFSSNLNPSAFQVHFGPTGFLSYVIPIVMLLCGVLSWLSPGQRLFYGILGALTAVYSLIGLNLGGFFLGLVLGVLGGALTAAWTHIAPPPAQPSPNEAEFDERYVGQTTTATYGAPIEAEPVAEEPSPQTSGVLTDSLPTSLRSPLLDERLPDERLLDERLPDERLPDEPLPDERLSEANGGGAGDADGERPPTPGGHRRLRYGGAIFAVLLLAVVSTYVASGARPALAAPSAGPCAPAATKTLAPKSPSATPASPSTTNKAPAQPKAGGSASPSVSPTPAPSPSASASSADHGGNIVTNIIGGIVGLWNKLTGHDQKTADPGAAAASPAPSASPSPSRSAPHAATPKPATSASPSSSGRPSRPASRFPTSPAPCLPSGPAKRAAAEPGQPAVSSNSSLVLSSTQEMHGLSYDGVIELPTKTADGKPSSVRVLKFSMTAVTNTPFEMRTPGGPKILETTSDQLTLSGHVEFYTTKLVGKLQLIPGLPPLPIELTFTPDSPPPLTLPEMTFKDVRVDLVYVKCDALTADNFDLRFAA
jgi:hypothetical protein